MQQIYSLRELNTAVSDVLADAFHDSYWITAEISELRVNASGHCYMELIEKITPEGNPVARARAMIWSNLYPALRNYFEEETGQALASGIKVLVNAQVTFHTLYGYSLNIIDINPTYTIGDLAKRRKAILKQLEQEGILNMNKELPWPDLPKRIAVISSRTAAGYGDFCDQLAGNSHGFAFYPTLFPAVMQGERVEQTIIQALNHISDRIAEFDVVVIIRGGGATTDLAGFDNLLLAENCAQFPLPIITGIGHERDDTVLDIIAHTRVKTPTAVAECLISRMCEAEDRLLKALNTLEIEARNRLDSETVKVNNYLQRIPLLFSVVKNKEEHKLQFAMQRLRLQSVNCLQQENAHLHLLEEKIKNMDPNRILAKGYTLTLKNGKAVKDAGNIKTGDILTTCFINGKIQSTAN